MKPFSSSTRAALVCALVLLVATDLSAVSMRQLRRLYRKKDYDRAKRALLEELPSMNGRSRSEGLLLLARLETDVERAKDACVRVIREGRSRDALRARVELGKIYYATGLYERAVQTLSDIPSNAQSGDRFEAIYFRALSYKQLGDPERARRELDTVDRGDYLYWSYMALAELDMQEGRIDDAIERYESIAGGHYNPIAGFKLGECYEINGNREQAVEVYRTLISQFPHSLEAPKAREKIQMIRYARSSGRRMEPEPEGGEEGEITGSDEPLTDHGRVYRFTLQFGAFTERENAIKLAEKLRDSDGTIRVERIETNGNVWHRVRLGRFVGREEAEGVAERILREIGYPSTVVPL